MSEPPTEGRGGTGPDVEAEGMLLYHRRRKGAWAVALLRVDRSTLNVAPGEVVPIVGPALGGVPSGCMVRVHGRVHRHPHHGWQLRVTRLENEGVQCLHGAVRWLMHLPALDVELADRLEKSFPGGRLLQLLRAGREPGRPDPFADVLGVGPRRAFEIRTAWAELERTRRRT